MLVVRECFESKPALSLITGSIQAKKNMYGLQSKQSKFLEAQLFFNKEVHTKAYQIALFYLKLFQNQLVCQNFHEV